MMRFFGAITGIWVALAGAVAGEPLRVFAAASLAGALDEAARDWSGEAVISYGGSGGIARQVAAGAPADVVILANMEWLRWLGQRGALREGTARPLLSNRLVIVGPLGAPDLVSVSAADLVARLDGGRIAIGQVLSVPAGIYAKEWMKNAGLWDALSPHLAETGDVRAALALVARGEAPLGLVYETDARGAAVRVLYRVDPVLHAPIRYGAAVVHTSDHDQAADFLNYLATGGGGALARHGFGRVGAE